MSKRDALRWAELSPGYMGLELRPFADAAQRFRTDRSHSDNADPQPAPPALPEDTSR